MLLKEKREVRQDLLIFADSVRNVDLFYLSGFLAHDPFLCFVKDGQSYLVMNELEYGRACIEASVDQVLKMKDFSDRIQNRQKKDQVVSMNDIMVEVCQEYSLRDFYVPMDFPIWYGDHLRKKGIHFVVKKDPFLPQRMIKSESEIALLAQAQQTNEEGMRRLLDILAESSIEGGVLWWQKKPLSSEILKREYALMMLSAGYQVESTIVSCGEHTVDPHNTGSGPIYAHVPIILDLFPQHQTNRYWGDMTRTVVKGKATPELRRLWETVFEAQEMAIARIAPGVSAAALHSDVENFFTKKGYVTDFRDGRYQGFIHGTGHGVGLDIHELPRFSRGGELFQENQVVTVEPGLYYAGLGGVRLEDIVVVRSNHGQNLNKLEKILEIP